MPVAAAFDALLQAPDGALLALGWMLDPLRRVDRVLVKSTGNLYAPIHASWCALPRLDLHQGFGADPRFQGLLDEHDCLHGFIAHAPALRAETEGAVAKGVFGSPYVIVDGEPFWGFDRFDQLEAFLRDGRI